MNHWTNAHFGNVLIFSLSSKSTTFSKKLCIWHFLFCLQKVHEKSVLYNLNEEETQLTHYGQSLADIEKQETILESDEEEDGEPGM